MDNLTPRKGSAGLSSQLFPSQNEDNGTGEEDGDRNGPHVALAKHETKDPLLNKEKKFLFGSSNTLSLSFQSVASSSKFKETFDTGTQAAVSKPEKGPSLSKPESKPPDSRTSEKPEEDVMIIFEKGVTADLKEKAKRLQLPSNFFGYECSAPEVSSDLSETDAR